MGKSTCFVYGCKTGYATERKRLKAEGSKNPSLFSAPKDDATFERWKRKIPREGFSKNDRVCEKHFTDDCLIKFNETKLPDGKIERIALDIPRLKKDSVPSIFPGPAYLSSVPKKRKSPKKRDADPAKINKIEPVRHLSHLPEDNVIMFEAVAGTSGYEQEYNFNQFKLDMKKHLPDPWTLNEIERNDENALVFILFDDKYAPAKCIAITQDLIPQTFVKCVPIPFEPFDQKIKNRDDFLKVLLFLKEAIYCAGSDNTIERMKSKCDIIIKKSSRGEHFQKIRCANCQKLRNNILKRRRRINRRKKTSSKITLLKKKNSRLRAKVSNLNMKVTSMMKMCTRKSQKVLENEIKDLPEPQKENIRMILKSAKVKNSKGLRYSTKWIYQCVLLRIKSRSGYKHLRKHKILILPSIVTITKYLKKIRPIYGFLQETFETLKLKTKEMDEKDRRGSLIFDEIKITKGVQFDASTFKTIGFVDLGCHTPTHNATDIADHALVFLFQPFRGKWFQCIGSFLSKGATKGNVLKELVVEAIALLENSNLKVDALICDGATWNRRMWTLLNVSLQQTYIPHTMDSKRNLYVFSDFSHLIKNIRNCLADSGDHFWTPDGDFKIQYFENLLKLENEDPYTLKLAPKLTPVHVHPTTFDKMNVGRALQFFNQTNAAAMDTYRDVVRRPEMIGCEATCSLIRKFDQLIEVMTGRHSRKALTEEKCKVIESFLEFFEAWEKGAEERKERFISASTTTGMKITLKNTILLAKYLFSTGWTYFLPARLLQDVLERFFSMVRESAGCDDSPNAVTFAQIFRLLSTYSLLSKTPGMNATEGEILKTLTGIDDVNRNSQRTADNWFKLADDIIDRGDDVIEVQQIFQEHLYSTYETTKNECIRSYMAGYIVRKSKTFLPAKCITCKETLKKKEPDEKDHFIELKMQNNEYKPLYFPSTRLYNLVSQLESLIMEKVESQLTADTFLEIMEVLSNSTEITLVGCCDHQFALTEKIVKFYTIMRYRFLCNAETEKLLQKQKKKQSAVKHKKMAIIVK